MKNTPRSSDGRIMNNIILIGGLAAFATGIAIGLQTYLSGRAGIMVGAIKTGLWTNFLGGVLAGMIILLLQVLRKDSGNAFDKHTLGIIVLSGALGILIITGIAYSINLAGVAAGGAAVFFGQMVLSAIADTMGWGGAEPIPLDMRRILGLILMSISVFLLLPRE